MTFLVTTFILGQAPSLLVHVETPYRLHELKCLLIKLKTERAVLFSTELSPQKKGLNQKKLKKFLLGKYKDCNHLK